MKIKISLYLLICFALIANAQQNFDNDWQNVEAFEKEGLTKSAANYVEKIYQKSVKTNNTQQRIKALLYKSKYMQVLEEDAQLNIITLFKAEIKTSDTVTKHVLENMLATMYWQYFQQNRHQFYNRSKTAEKLNEDFRTWDLQTLHNEIHLYFQSSLKDELVLQQKPTAEFSTLLTEVKNSKQYRPTIFDILCHNALDFYKTPENSITQPTYNFNINNPDFFKDYKTFSDFKFTTKDSLSLQLQSLKIYQKLYNAHSKSNTVVAKVVNDIDRLVFLNQYSNLDHKDELFLEALQKGSEKYSSQAESGLYNFEIAKLYQNQGYNYNKNLELSKLNNKNRWALKKAIDLCNTTITKFPKSEAAKKCAILKQQIQTASLTITAETYCPINTPNKLLVTYKNLETLNFKIYKVTKAQLDSYFETYNNTQQLNFINSLTETHSFNKTLKSEGDFQNHSTEIVIPNLQNGLYLIKAEAKDNVFSAAHFQITNLALIESNTNNAHKYQLINRNNGTPITNTVVTVSYSTNRTKTQTKQFTTDNYGFFSFKKDANYYRSVEIKTVHEADSAYFGNYYINRLYEKNDNSKTNYNTYIFTDRSIYRPGQTVFFKGIVTQTNANKTIVTNNEAITAELYNVNGEKLSTLQFKTNNYGSFSGEFSLPNDGLTGNFQIRTASNTIRNQSYNFSVEAYKRPKFKPEFLPITKTYSVNDTITVKGKTLAYAGSAIADAKVTYRVTRKIQFPNWYYWRHPYNNSQAQEITFGDTKTNANGDFEIKFKALADASISKTNAPLFRYEISADITDINGETRSTSTIINVGYQAFTLNIDVTNQIHVADKTVAITLDSKNTNGEFAPANGTLKIYKLNAPNNVLRPRPWDAPDFPMLAEADFKKLFPHEAYKNEAKISNWAKGALVHQQNFDTKIDKKILLKKLKNWETGTYVISAETKDKNGLVIKDEAYTTLVNPKEKTVADQQLFTANLDKEKYSVGDVATLTMGSAAKNITVTVEIEKNNNIVSTQLITFNASKSQISIPVEDTDVGGFIIHCSYTAFNSFNSERFIVNVPHPKTDLEIETISFRNKLLPGQNETWSFKIKGAKGEKVSAELLASMYDASLDAFKSNNWTFNPISKPNVISQISRNASQSFGTTNFSLLTYFKPVASYPIQNYDRINWFGFQFGTTHYTKKRYSRLSEPMMMVEDDAEMEEVAMTAQNYPNANVDSLLSGQVEGIDIETGSGKIGSDTSIIMRDSIDKNIPIRKNLNETAFFYPKLHTDTDGSISFNFTTPEALTQWKLQLLAHTQTLESKVIALETVTQKDLMVVPNAPRFLREGDLINISSKIVNLSNKPLSGLAKLVLTNPITGENLDEALSNSYNALGFSVAENANTQVTWQIQIPEGLQAVQYKIVAVSGNFSDGEQNVLPVLSNRKLVTETLPMWVNSDSKKSYTLNALKTNTSSTLKHHKLSLELTSNPAWYAVQALPYLMEFPHNCNEQTFSRYYANTLASYISNSNPKIQAVFNQWKNSDALISNLEKNAELKSILIENTPWLSDAQSETEQKKRIGLLFDLNHMQNQQRTALMTLKNNQESSGAWSWFKGGRDNRYITQHIITGFGHLKKIGVTDHTNQNTMVLKALNYLDAEFVKTYNDLKKYNPKIDFSKDHLNPIQLHYLYLKSFFPEVKISKEVKTISDYYLTQIKKYWLKRSLYEKGLMTMVANRNNDHETATKILKSLKETSLTSEELGMYWKANTSSWHWYQAPIETQALLIEAFSEAGHHLNSDSENLKIIDNLKLWLLKNKQTNQWKSTKATADAVYALLLNGSDWLSVTDSVNATVGGQPIAASKIENTQIEAGTGYFKTSWNASEIKPELAEITLTKKGKGVAWGSLYWQYFEDLDKITAASSQLKLSKKLFKKTNTHTGQLITEITSKTTLKIGDLVRIRIELRSDRPMEFIHLKDMRAAGLEPINVLSSYKWQDGLGYYESTKDAATHFFIDYLPKGIFVFEYDLRVNSAGTMSNGISTIQSMYAPEFSSHSEGIRISVD